MRTVVHLSDLHFGKHNPSVVRAATEAVWRLAPHVVAVSGDLTQRARSNEFKQARAFLHDLPPAQVVVPGNHDVPLWNLWRRFGQSLAKFQRFVSPDLSPVYHDEELYVRGVNTARAGTIAGGRISLTQTAAVVQALRPLPQKTVRILVTHHPFVPPPSRTVPVLGQGLLALKMLAATRVHVLLAGHLHHGFTREVSSHYPSLAQSTLVVQAGTATSNRLRGEPNSFNVITVRPNMLEVAAWVFDGTRFVSRQSITYALIDDRWRAQTYPSPRR